MHCRGINRRNCCTGMSDRRFAVAVQHRRDDGGGAESEGAVYVHVYIVADAVCMPLQFFLHASCWWLRPSLSASQLFPCFRMDERRARVFFLSSGFWGKKQGRGAADAGFINFPIFFGSLALLSFSAHAEGVREEGVQARAQFPFFWWKSNNRARETELFARHFFQFQESKGGRESGKTRGREREKTACIARGGHE